MSGVDTSTGSRHLNRYIVGVALVGLVAACVLWVVAPPASPGIGALITLGVLAVIGRSFPVRFQRKGETQGFNFIEGVFVAALFVLPYGLIPLVVGGGVLVGHLATRDLRKLTFNTGQTLLWAAVAVAMFQAVAGGQPDPLSVRGLVGATAATAALNIVSLAAMAELIRRLNGRGRLETIREVSQLQVLTWGGNLSFGLVLALLMERSPYAGFLATTLMLGLSLGYRGFANALEERRRNGLLEGVVFTLADVNSSTDSVETFL
ncbi:MAG TPA: hypothetical protein VGA36_06990, partial [Nitriliruptorales bacterium]